MTDSCTFLYKRLERQNVLKGFGCVDGEYPEKSVDITPAKLEQITGKPSRVLFCRHCRTYFSVRMFLHYSIYSMISFSSYSYYVKILCKNTVTNLFFCLQFIIVSTVGFPLIQSHLYLFLPLSLTFSLSLSSFFVLFLSLHLYLFPSIYFSVHLIIYLTIIIFLRFEHSCSDTNATHNLLATSRHRLLSR